MAAPRKENIRQRILQVTIDLLSRTSFAGLSLATIAEETGISKGTLYYHFHCKDELLLGIADYYMAEQRAGLQQWIDAHGDKSPTLQQLLSHMLVRAMYNAYVRTQLYTEAMRGNALIRQKLCAFYNSYHDLITQKLIELTPSYNADYLGWLTLLAADGMYIQGALGNERMDINAFLDTTSEVINIHLPKPPKT